MLVRKTFALVVACAALVASAAGAATAADEHRQLEQLSSQQHHVRIRVSTMHEGALAVVPASDDITDSDSDSSDTEAVRGVPVMRGRHREWESPPPVTQFPQPPKATTRPTDPESPPPVTQFPQPPRATPRPTDPVSPPPVTRSPQAPPLDACEKKGMTKVYVQGFTRVFFCVAGEPCVNSHVGACPGPGRYSDLPKGSTCIKSGSTYTCKAL